MILKTVAEVAWKYYSDGKPSANKQKLSEGDMRQMVRMAAANNFRQLYLFGQKIIPGKKLIAPPEEGDYYFTSPLLSVKRFELPEADNMGMRRADMQEFDLYRLPHNAHFENIYMVNGTCAGLKTNVLTLVANGEEKFYAGKSRFRSYIFGSIVGRGINTFNVPPCIKKIDVETTYDSDDIDVTLDVAFDVVNEVLRLSLEIEQVSGDDKIRLQEELKKREDIK